jgi:hypothetical protein
MSGFKPRAKCCLDTALAGQIKDHKGRDSLGQGKKSHKSKNVYKTKMCKMYRCNTHEAFGAVRVQSMLNRSPLGQTREGPGPHPYPALINEPQSSSAP